MISFIYGTVVDSTETSVIVEAGGIGYEIFMTGSAIEQAVRKEGQVKIHTHFHVREDAMQLFGFLSKDDLQMFRLLLGVNGIGPKAQKLILELKDKLKLEDAFEKKLAHEQEAAAISGTNILDGSKEAVEALVALGYSSTDALRAVRKVTDVPPDDVEAILKAALKNL